MGQGTPAAQRRRSIPPILRNCILHESKHLRLNHPKHAFSVFSTARKPAIGRARTLLCLWSPRASARAKGASARIFPVSVTIVTPLGTGMISARQRMMAFPARSKVHGQAVRDPSGQPGVLPPPTQLYGRPGRPARNPAQGSEHWQQPKRPVCGFSCRWPGLE